MWNQPVDLVRRIKQVLVVESHDDGPSSIWLVTPWNQPAASWQIQRLALLLNGLQFRSRKQMIRGLFSTPHSWERPSSMQVYPRKHVTGTFITFCHRSSISILVSMCVQDRPVESEDTGLPDTVLSRNITVIFDN